MVVDAIARQEEVDVTLFSLSSSYAAVAAGAMDAAVAATADAAAVALTVSGLSCCYAAVAAVDLAADAAST